MKRNLLPLLFLVCPAMELSAVTLLVDFGPAATVSTSPSWNNFTGTASGVPLALNDTSGASTGYSITLAGGTVGQDNNNAVPVNQFSPSHRPMSPATSSLPPAPAPSPCPVWIPC